MHRVVHFEFAAEDPERAAEFYRQAFGWQIKKWDGPAEYWLVVTGAEGEAGINGGILRHKDGMPRTVNTIAVESVDAAAQQVVRCGGQVVVPKMPIPGVGYLAYCQDTEGLLFGIHQLDPSAK
jgi:predicted enzyme related to lactoylglutathione lyase